MRYDYNGYTMKQRRKDNYYTITIYLDNKVCFMTHSKRLIEKDEFVIYIKSVISKIHKELENA